MTESDVLRLSINKLNELAKFYGLQTTGKQNIYQVRKCAVHPNTKKKHYLKKSMATPDLRTAVLRAAPLVEDWLATIEMGIAPAVKSPNRRRLNLARLRAAYLAAPTVRAGRETRLRNFADLIRVIQKVHGDEFVWETTDVGVVNRELAKEYQRRRLAEIEEFSGRDLLAVESGKRALNSTLAHAQSVFSRPALEDYHELGLPPTVREFADALGVAARKAEPPEALDVKVVQAILEGLPLLRVSDPGAWVVVRLMLWGGLRNTDCLHARESWLIEDVAGWRLRLVPTAEYRPKGRSGSVVLPQDLVEDILALRQGEMDAGVEDPHLVPAKHKSDRVTACYRRAGAWLRSCGLDKEAGKVAYRLRKHFLRLVDAQQGRAAAIAAARHADKGQTLTAHYIGEDKMAAPVQIA